MLTQQTAACQAWLQASYTLKCLPADCVGYTHNIRAREVAACSRPRRYQIAHPDLRSIVCHLQPVAYPGILFETGSTNSVEDRGQRERGCGGGSPLFRGSGGSCNLVQEISFHIVKVS